MPKNFNEILQSGNEKKIKEVFQTRDINATDKDGNTILHMLHADKDIKKKDPNSPYAYMGANLIEWIIMQGGDINAKNKKGETPLRNFMWYVYKNLKPHQKLIIVGNQGYASSVYVEQVNEVVNIDFGIMYNYIYNLLPEKSRIYVWRRFGKKLEYLYVPEYPTDMEKYDPQEYSKFTYDFWMKFLRQKDSERVKITSAKALGGSLNAARPNA